MITHYSQAVAAINTFVPKRSMVGNYNHDTMGKLLAYLDNPQEKLRIVHIAGTSGKTSTAYLIRALLEEAGVKTGLTVSPHIATIRERVQVGGEPISEETFTAYANEFLRLVAKSKLEPTYFELMITFAWWVFMREGAEIAVIETGIGGRYDATNMVKRADKLCVLTDIGLDHTEILGDTLAAIAAQKAGIIQPGNVVVAQPQDTEVMDVFATTAKKQHAEFHVAQQNTRAGLPPFQNRNWSIAIAAYDLLGLPQLAKEQLARAATKLPPGRMEALHIGSKTVILDGAHNSQKLRALHEALLARGITKTAVIANFVEAPDAKITEALTALAPFTAHLIAPGFEVKQDFYNRHSLTSATMVARATKAGIPEAVTANDVAEAIKKLFARPEETVIVTGSFYLISAVREQLLNAA
jgi:dihydrofolate synthase / folylpolyglutamate synthase